MDNEAIQQLLNNDPAIYPKFAVAFFEDDKVRCAYCADKKHVVSENYEIGKMANDSINSISNFNVSPKEEEIKWNE